MTVGELRERLKEARQDSKVFFEASLSIDSVDIENFKDENEQVHLMSKEK